MRPPVRDMKGNLTAAAAPGTPVLALESGICGGRALSAGDGAHDQEGLAPGRHGLGQLGVRRLVRQVLPGGEEPHERPALLRDVVADRPAQRREAGLERVKDRELGRLALDVELHLALDAGERLQVRREDDPDHDSVCTSTDRTAGRLRTLAAHDSPASVDPYTCPTEIPKHT